MTIKTNHPTEYAIRYIHASSVTEMSFMIYSKERYITLAQFPQSTKWFITNLPSSRFTMKMKYGWNEIKTLIKTKIAVGH